MRTVALILIAFLCQFTAGEKMTGINTGTAATSVSVPLTIQEALYAGITGGIIRTSEPLTVGVPLPDSATGGASNVSSLQIAGASTGQFRALGYWPSGRIKWVLVDTLASVSAGSTNTSYTVNGSGSGNYGGSNLATDNGATITIATGAATFTIKKANFNGFDQVVVGSTTVVSTGASTGLVVMGPVSPGTTCGTCTTVYSSANDASSTATIEENGPVRAVVKATGSYKDGSGNAYLKFTVRMHFYKGLTRVRAVTSLQNADFGASGSFATAFKGMAANEWRVTANIAGTRTFNIGKASNIVETGTLTGTDDVYLYSAFSTHLLDEQYSSTNDLAYVAPTADTGWTLNKNSVALATGTSTQPVAGWADIQDASGVGVSIGVEQMAAYWPKSLEFKSGGSDVRIGIWPSENSRAYHQAWPQWSTHDLYFNFHDAALSSAANEFLKFQHPLLARASVNYYNSTNALPYPIVSATTEDAFLQSTHDTAVPAATTNFTAAADASPGGAGIVQGELQVYRNKAWRNGGESNQQEFRYSWLVNFIQRGFTGRYLHAKYFYRFLTDDGEPHSDGFTWSAYTQTTVDTFGRPAATSTNSAQAYRAWSDEEHRHWYGMIDYYFMSGAEEVKDAILDGWLDWHLNPNTNQAGLSSGTQDGLSNERSDGVNMLSAARMITFLRAVNETASAATALTNIEASYAADVSQVLCTNAEAASQGCTSGNVITPALVYANEGISRTRGLVWTGMGTQTWCGVTPGGYWRITQVWNGSGFWALGLWELLNMEGTGWSHYWEARDLLYGVIQGAEGEMWVESGNNRWDEDYWRIGITPDRAGNCDTPPPTQDAEYFNHPNGVGHVPVLSHWMLHYVKAQLDGSTDWINKVKINLANVLNYNGGLPADLYGYELGATIYAYTNTTGPVLQSQTITQFTNNGGGSYTIGWTVPSGASSYRIKWGTKTIVDWIGFNPATNAFTGNPTTTMNWFAATHVDAPSPATAGTTQTMTISTGTTGLTSANFSVKAFVPRTTSGPTSISWTNTNNTDPDKPAWVGFNSLHYDPVSGKVLFYERRNTSSTIFSTDVFTYTTGTGDFVRLGGTGTVGNTCNDGSASDLTPWPPDRHPEHMTIDTVRSLFVIFGGLCNGVDKNDQWHMTLNANPASNTFASFDISGSIPTVRNSGDLVYDATDDVYVLFGPNTAFAAGTWVLCRSTGSLTAAQTAAGCSSANVWANASPTGSPSSLFTFPMLRFDPVTNKVYAFLYDQGGSASTMQVWTYTVGTKTWANRSATNAPSEPASGTPEQLVAYISSGTFAGKFIYHQTSHQQTGGTSAADYLYDPATNTFTALSSTGTGPVNATHLTWDATANKIVAWEDGDILWTAVLN